MWNKGKSIYNDVMKKTLAQDIEYLQSTKLTKNSLAKQAYYKKYNIKYKNIRLLTNEMIIHIIVNRLKYSDYMYKDFSEGEFVYKYTENDTYEELRNFYISVSRAKPECGTDELFMGHIKTNTKSTEELYNKIAGPIKCSACGESMKLYNFGRPITRRTCTEECRIRDISRRMCNGENPHDKSDFALDPAYRKRKSDLMKKKIRDGEFTPCVTNSRCKSRTVVGNIPFRSTWEAYFYIFQTYVIQTVIHFEELRIPYKIDNKMHNYIVDFIDHNNKKVYEIKPDSEKNTEANIAKNKALVIWCKEHNYTFEYISNNWFNRYYFSEVLNEYQDNIEYTSYKKMIRNLKAFDKNTTPIKILEKTEYSGDTYNLHVEQNHNYYADNLLVSNCHGSRGDQTSDIIRNCVNARFKLGLTGTLPDNPIEKMEIFSQLGIPKTYIKTQELINLGLATPVNINIIKLKYSSEFVHQISKEGTYSQRLKLLKEHKNRTEFVSSLTVNTTKSTGNSIMLYQHTEHGKELFTRIFKLRTGIDIDNKHITGKKAFEFQKEHRIYFINGEVKDTIREEIRQIFDKDSDVILVGNYSVLSTGVNLRRVHNIIFGSPMKSFISITQSLGRGIRLHPEKSVVNIYDIADDLAAFRSQLKYRIKASYESEGFPIFERSITI